MSNNAIEVKDMSKDFKVYYDKPNTLKEKIVLNQEASIGTRLNFLSDDKFVMAIGNSEIIKVK